MLTISELLNTRTLHALPRRDREVLFAYVLRKPREWILTHPEATVRTTMAARYRRLLRRLERGEPLPYLLGEHWFYGRPFTVNRHVLIPRPETELMVELAIERIKNYESRIMETSTIVDVGTGSGCIAVTLAAELPHTNVVAIDSSPTALRIARANARRHGVENLITFLQGNLLEPILQSPSFMIHHSLFTVCANLPYLTTDEWRALPRSLRQYEPRAAFDGGPDGLRPFRKLFAQIRSIPIIHHSLFMILETDPRRKRALTPLIRKTLPGWKASWHRDLAGRWRVLVLSSKP
ncbi:peptide chain release factor N(5)-glutamine methyltransferase [Candidatus Uhrbacteria bacterium]|nr:peptide chain release factor N(5)-glutamine methyltransferase [Candidatus Uhrbacteria bacterium]